MTALLVLLTLQPYAILYAQETPPETTPTETQQTSETPAPEPTPTQSQDVTVNNTDTQSQTNLDVDAGTGGNTAGSEATPTPSPETTPETAAEQPVDEGIISPLGDGYDPTPTPTDGDQQGGTESAATVDNTASVESSVSATSNTGNNTVNTSSGNTSQGGGGGGGGESQSGATTSPTATPTPLPFGTTTTETGDAYSYGQLENAVNTTSVNSQIVYHTINLYMNETGTIDLSLPAELARILVEQNPNDPTINATLANLNVTNEADVTANVNVSANTGGNVATDSAKATITTGDAFAILSLLNRINFVMIDSVLHVAIINIFGSFTGDILLPDIPALNGTACTECGSLTVGNNADVTTNVNVTSDTGNNTVTSANGTIDSGNAYTAVNVINLVNQVVYGSPYLALYVNNFGVWNGQFLGYATDGLPTTSETTVPATSCTTCIGDINISNDATLTNNINVTATTGNNSVDAVWKGAIETGNAYTVATVMNIVNTSLIRSFGLLGFINIFGTWTGNIGSKSLFPTATSEGDNTGGPTDGQQTQAAASGSQESKPERGGLLSVTNSNNVGAYVHPGDTVTLFINTKNPGTGRVYGAKLVLMLIKDGVEAGTTVFELGNIDAGKSVKLTTGMVLAKDAPSGEYKVRAGVYGYTANEHDEMVKVNAYADSLFAVGPATIALGGGQHPGATVAATPTPAIMGATHTRPVEPNLLKALLVLFLLIPMYLAMRLTREREQLGIIFSRQFAAAVRLRALSLFLI